MYSTRRSLSGATTAPNRPDPPPLPGTPYARLLADYERLQAENARQVKAIRLCRAAISAIMVLPMSRDLSRKVLDLLTPAQSATSPWADTAAPLRAPAPVAEVERIPERPTGPAYRTAAGQPRWCQECGGEELLVHPRDRRILVCRECHNQQPVDRHAVSEEAVR